MSARHRILFVEASVGGVLGGSLTGILQLIEHLDRFATILQARPSHPEIAHGAAAPS